MTYPRPADDHPVTCAKCGQTKPAKAFAADNRRPSGLEGGCRDCRKKKAPAKVPAPKPRGTIKPEPVKLAGRKSGYACKIYIKGAHVATVADPENSSREGAIAAALRWEHEWMDILIHRNVSN